MFTSLLKHKRKKRLIKEWFLFSHPTISMETLRTQSPISANNQPFSPTSVVWPRNWKQYLFKLFFSNHMLYLLFCLATSNFISRWENYENPLLWRNTKCLKIRKMGFKYLWWIFVLVSWIFCADLFLRFKVWLMFWRSWEVVITAAVAAWNDQLANLSEKWQQTICHNQNQKRLPRPTFCRTILTRGTDASDHQHFHIIMVYRRKKKKQFVEEKYSFCPIYQTLIFIFQNWFDLQAITNCKIVFLTSIKTWFSILSFFLKLHENLLAAGTFSHKPEFSSN